MVLQLLELDYFVQFWCIDCQDVIKWNTCLHDGQLSEISTNAGDHPFYGLVGILSIVADR